MNNYFDYESFSNYFQIEEFEDPYSNEYDTFLQNEEEYDY